MGQSLACVKGREFQATYGVVYIK